MTAVVGYDFGCESSKTATTDHRHTRKETTPPPVGNAVRLKNKSKSGRSGVASENVSVCVCVCSSSSSVVVVVYYCTKVDECVCISVCACRGRFGLARNFTLHTSHKYAMTAAAAALVGGDIETVRPVHSRGRDECIDFFCLIMRSGNAAAAAAQRCQS